MLSIFGAFALFVFEALLLVAKVGFGMIVVFLQLIVPLFQ